MQIIYNIFNVILDAGAVVMLPIIITICNLTEYMTKRTF